MNWNKRVQVDPEEDRHHNVMIVVLILSALVTSVCIAGLGIWFWLRCL